MAILDAVAAYGVSAIERNYECFPRRRLCGYAEFRDTVFISVEP
jgi:hypothetical protein